MGMHLLHLHKLDRCLSLSRGVDHVYRAPLEAQPDRSLPGQLAFERVIIVTRQLANFLDSAVPYVIHPGKQLSGNVLRRPPNLAKRERGNLHMSDHGNNCIPIGYAMQASKATNLIRADLK
jgi:hypothetical protein